VAGQRKRGHQRRRADRHGPNATRPPPPAPTKASLDENPTGIHRQPSVHRSLHAGKTATTAPSSQIAPSIAGISLRRRRHRRHQQDHPAGLPGRPVQPDLRRPGDRRHQRSDPTTPPTIFPASNIGSAVVDRGTGRGRGDPGAIQLRRRDPPVLADPERPRSTSSRRERSAPGTPSSRSPRCRPARIAQTGGTKDAADLRLPGFPTANCRRPGGLAYNGLLKIQQPLGPKGSVTPCSRAVEYTRFSSSRTIISVKPGSRSSLYGKKKLLALTKTPPPASFWDGYKQRERKRTDFRVRQAQL